MLDAVDFLHGLFLEDEDDEHVVVVEASHVTADYGVGRMKQVESLPGLGKWSLMCHKVQFQGCFLVKLESEAQIPAFAVEDPDFGWAVKANNEELMTLRS